ncbi:MAG: hypothetical protein HY565_05060 [Candidatus Kerfeldbacteria bacterium]|nr:hypothetical protein [Candidatus Kerfeldbacteria bacterium]
MRKPEDIIQLKPDERIVLAVREYVIMPAVPLTIALLGYLVVVFFMYYAWSLGWIARGVWLVTVLLLLGYSLRRIRLWFGEVFIVTNQRCIDVQQTGLFAKAVKEIAWSVVDDIRFSQRGLVATLCHYGTVTLILSTGSQIDLQHVYQPDRVRDILAEYVQKLR